MGSILTHKNDCMPEIYSFAQYQQTVKYINSISIHLSSKFNYILNIYQDTLYFNYTNWKLSTVKATIGLNPQKQKKLREHEQDHLEQSFVYDEEIQVTLDMRQIYQLYDLLKYFKEQETLSKKQIQSTPTPTEKGQKTCEICYDEEPDQALPCGHRFGANCISKYIIQKQEKVCPMCRRQFIGTKSSIQRDLFTIIDNDQKYVYEQISGGLLRILKTRNQKSIRKVQAFLKGRNSFK